VTLDPIGRGALDKATRRLVPVMAICYFFAYLDRTNLSIAALTMNKDVGITPTAYGFGAGLLFIGYILLDAPSNVVLHRVGASRWMARIMVVWGIVAAACALIQGELSFDILRFLLGMAEAGFFPGMVLYLTYWFPAARRSAVVGLFMVAVPLSTALGAPLGGLLLGLNGLGGLAGWRWLFVIEGLPSVLLGLLLIRLLPDRPAQAKWLSAEEIEWVEDTLAKEHELIESRPMSIGRAWRHPRVIGLGLVYFTVAFGLYGLGFWMPQIIKASLKITSNLDVSLLTAAPYAVGAVAMVVWGRWCDRSGRTALYTAVPLLVGGAALVVSTLLTGLPWLGYVGLCVCAVGVLAAFPGFWKLPSTFLAGAAAAVGIGVINSIGNVAGFLGPYWVGWMTDLFGAAKWGLVTIGIVMIAGSALVARVGRDMAPRASGAPVADPATSGP
jgi:MFS family permease